MLSDDKLNITLFFTLFLLCFSLCFFTLFFTGFLTKPRLSKTNTAEKQDPWRLATVTKVEEVKLIVNMIPIPNLAHNPTIRRMCSASGHVLYQAKHDSEP